MALDTTAVANLIETTITHLQLHNGAPGAGYTANVVTGGRVAASGKVAGNNAITLTGTWTGVLPANQTITHVSYWTASTAGTNYGGATISSGDTSANAAGDFVVNVTETGSAS